MANNNLKKLQSASFKGFNFLVEGESENDLGRRISIHDFPNSGKRFAQDLGLIKPTYEVLGVVAGGNFLNDAEQFKRVLDSEGEGQLVLPHLGALDVVALPYSVDYSHKSIGVIRFKLSFTISDASEVPAPTSSSIEDVYQAGDNVREYMQSGFAEGYQVPEAESDYLTAFNDYREAVVGTVENFSAQAITLNSKVQKIVRDVQNDLVSIVLAPQQLAEKLIYGNIALANGLFATFSALFSGEDAGEDFVKPNPFTALLATKYGSDFSDLGASDEGAGYPEWPETTGNRQLRNNNRRLTAETVKFNSLVLGYETAANFDYKTSEEIQAMVVTLEEEYSNLMYDTVSENSKFANDSNFKLLLDYLREEAYSVLEQKAQQVYTVGTLYAGGQQSIMNLSYKLYAEQLETPEDLQNMAESMTVLNPNIPPLKISGEIKIFEVVDAFGQV